MNKEVFRKRTVFIFGIVMLCGRLYDRVRCFEKPCYGFFRTAMFF